MPVILLTVFLFALSCRGQSFAALTEKTYWILPSNTTLGATGSGQPDYTVNPRWQIGETLLLQWKTDLNEYHIDLWQQHPAGVSADHRGAILSMHDSPVLFHVWFISYYPLAQSDLQQVLMLLTDKTKNNPINGQYSWKVDTTGLRLSDSPIFFLGLSAGLTESSDVQYSRTSCYFNITEAPVSSVTTSASTSAVTSASSSITLVPAITTSIGASPDEGAPSFGLTGSAKTGLGLGLGIGLPVAIAAMGLVYYYMRGSSKQAKKNNLGIENGQKSPYGIVRTREAETQ